jgi:catechol 2,3-dioxygenase-like lactoylglutathione lyase family enzyme
MPPYVPSSPRAQLCSMVGSGVEHTGVRHIAFAVDDIDAVVASLRACGSELVGDVEPDQNSYRLSRVTQRRTSKLPMTRSAHLLFAAAILVAGCTRHAPVPAHGVTLHDGTPAAAGTRFAIQFNNEPPIIYVADGRGGPPLLYHGHEIETDQLKSVTILKGKEARARFGDQTLEYGILFEFK